MLKSLTILVSDQKSKYETYFSISAMEDMILKGMIGVPMHLGHDMHRPIGIMKSLGIFFEPHLVQNIGVSFIPENDEEKDDILRFKKHIHLSHVVTHVNENQDKLYNEVKSKLKGDYKYLKNSTLSILNNDIVKRFFPKLKELSDDEKSGLIKISDLETEFDYKYQGIFVHKKLPLCIFCHQYFRRSLSRLNNFHYFFLDELLSHKHNIDITIKIALDWDMIGYAPDVLESMEFEYWFGPKYNNDINQITNGLTKYSTDEFERNYYGISTTEFIWKSNNELKEFELEELRENQSPTEGDYYGCRYVHSIYDTSQSTFIHFDGAIRGYDSELYFQRIDNDMNEFGRKSQYKKLFRVDGKLELKDWKSLLTTYMQDNPLIYEYFGVTKPLTNLQSNDEDETPCSHSVLVPNSMNKEDGLKFLLSYHDKNTQYLNYSHAVSIYDSMKINDVQVDIIEDEIIELKKYLNTQGKNLFIEPNTLFVNCKDEYWNIPCIFHGIENPKDDLNMTVSGLKLIFSKLLERKLETIISFTISWNDEEKEVMLSCIGHVENLYNWLQSFQEIPLHREDIKIWLEKQRTYLNNTFQSKLNYPPLQNIIQHDGVLYIKRKLVGAEFNLKPYFEEETLKCSMTFPDDGINYDEVRSGKIQPTMFYINKAPKCSICSDDYFNCIHSKLFNNQCFINIKEMDGLTFYWTDKIAK
ncbi:hypothetical protein HX071_17300 [Myroides marinus]|uniref:hypothetical protein n=1 Tax=Myroides marinus TaxID=703342 RepID=UPI002577D3AE|nr:hypothetical protein [Myroides marinus]MDM1503937.1 hypothetical protein [Myroides marinus]